jgi:hypothetical protein
MLSINSLKVIGFLLGADGRVMGPDTQVNNSGGIKARVTAHN